MASRSLLATASRGLQVRRYPGLTAHRLLTPSSFLSSASASPSSISASLSTSTTTAAQRQPQQKKRFGLRTDLDRDRTQARTPEPEAEPTPVSDETEGAASAVPADPAPAESKPAGSGAAVVTGAEAWTVSYPHSFLPDTQRAGLHPDVAAQLVSAFPEAVAPTPGQRAFLMTVARGGTDVYLKDYMGRGKTFALVLAALSLARRGGHQVVLLLPTPHLAQQVSDLLVRLAPGGKILHTLVSEHGADWAAPIVVATPRVLNDSHMPYLDKLTHIFLDEPDTMFGPLPGRYMSPFALAKHPINRHPPPVVAALNTLLNIKTRRGDKIDFSERRVDVRTVWASATFGPAMRRFVYGRGWALSAKTSGGESRGLVDLNFTAGSSAGQREVIETLRLIGEAGGVGAVEPIPAPKPQHFALSVGPTGRMRPLTIEHIHAHGERRTQRGEKDDLVQLTLVEAMAFIHATSPPPPGTYALVLPPRSGSLKALAAELTKLGIAVAPLVPEALDGSADGGVQLPAQVSVPKPDEQGMAPVLLSPRAAMAGLHLPQLHTVYLLNGLDMASVTPAQMKLGGRHERETQYAVISGRLGRMGTQAAHVPGHPQRVVSLVSAGSFEEAAMEDLFAGRLNSEKNAMFRLAEWTGEL